MAVRPERMLKPCVACGASDRYDSGNCRPCTLARSKEWRRKNPEKSKAATLAWRHANPERFKARLAKWDRANPTRRMLTSARTRARALGVPFNLKQSDLDVPGACPVLGIPLRRGVGKLEDSSPTLDRIIPELGYVVGNVRVISWRANRLKSDASVDEIRKILEYVTAVAS